MIITSYFTLNGAPAIGLSPLPTIQIWSITGTSSSLIVNGDSTNEIGGGFYQYLFSSYDSTQDYAFRTDGGTTYVSDTPERYQSGSIEAVTLVDNGTSIINGVWNATAIDYTVPGTMGLLENQINANVISVANNLYISANSVMDIVNLIVKYQTNRTRIDSTALTLTVYDDDCTTPLRVFQLLDSSGNPSITQVAERKPIAANDGLPVC